MWKDVWGEQMTSKQKTVLCILDVESGVASVLENIPENVSAGKVTVSLVNRNFVDVLTS